MSRNESFALTVNASLASDRRVMVLTADDGTVRAALTPAVAEDAGLVGTAGPVGNAAKPLTEADFRGAIGAAGVTLHGADHLFYLRAAAIEPLAGTESRDDVRRLTADDAAVFADFTSSASDQDLDDAYVELDHWAVFGGFEGDRLVCAASAYPWGGARLADIGVLTLPEFRGRGHARAVVRALCRHALREGYQPQYRCQLDNEASVALAASAGLTHFGTWETVSAES